jgi:drug/metabolite transporter (DMT)-like permease
MDDLAFLLVVSSALFHALWNFYAKKSKANSVALIWAAQLLAGAITLPYSLYCFYTEGMSLVGLGYVVSTSLVHALYVYLLGTSYEIGDLSVVYPVARGTGIAGTAIVATLFGIDSLSLIGGLGVISVFVGTAVIGFSRKSTLEIKQVYRSALFVGCSIALYSLIDKMAVAHISPFYYVCILNIGSPLVLLPWIIARFRRESSAVLTGHAFSAAAIGMAGVATYGLVLWAMQLSPASYVVALREVSIPVAAVLGVFLLKEELTAKKIQGVLLILLGAALVKFA